MNTAGGQAENDIALLNRVLPDDFFLIDDSDRETGQVVVLRLHGAGVFRGFAADQGAAGPDAALRDTGNQRCDLFGLISANGNVVEEKQGPCAAADNVIDAHGDTVDPDGAVNAHKLGNTLFGADTIRAGNENG